MLTQNTLWRRLIYGGVMFLICGVVVTTCSGCGENMPMPEPAQIVSKSPNEEQDETTEEKQIPQNPEE